MKYLEYIHGHFYSISVKSSYLCQLIGDRYLFSSWDDELSFGWAIKGDSYISSNEKECDYDSTLFEQCNKIYDFDFCRYLIALFERYQTVGLIDQFDWLENANHFDPETQTNYSKFGINEKLTPKVIQNIISLLRNNYDEINDSVEQYCIIEYEIDGDYESKITVLSWIEGETQKETYEENEIDELMETDCFFRDFITGERDLDELLDIIHEKHYVLTE